MRRVGPFDEQDRVALERHGLSVAEAERHLALCARPPAMAVDRPCTVGDGIRRLSAAEVDRLGRIHDAARHRMGRFVPASGAASRMFRGVLSGEDEARWRAVQGRLGIADAEAAARLPKALIPGWAGQTALALQLEETAGYAARLHLTISAEHAPAFAAAVGDAEVSWSCQAPSTDVVAADPGGGPLRPLLFRPGGHGALLPNLAALGGDVVFVKNIDNVQPAAARSPTLRWKKALGGLFLELEASRTDESRPLRVCGVVPNTGEPGGGPFWARDAFGALTPQIVEAQQVAAGLVAAGTHFNPVDLVCGLRNRAGEPYDLTGFVDPNAVMVSRKSHDGRDLLAVERPGLWNGAMSGWETVFVEVPGETFTPVKTVFDLLRWASL